MSKRKILTVLYHELERVNAEIDKKIIKGASYRRESKRHKEILHRLRRMKGGFSWTFPFRTFGF